MRKVICTHCERLIQGTEDPPEYKKCIDCVLKTTPGADLSKVVDSTGKRYENKKKKIKKSPRVQQMFDNIVIEGERYPAPIALFLVTNYEKTCTIDFGLNFAQVKEMYDVMCEMKVQNKRIIDEHEAGHSDDSE